MKLNSAQLEAFYAVSRLGHFSKAAKHLSLTQSALSQRILNLEQRLETQLFLREPSGVRLTESGESLLRYCQSYSALESDLLDRISSANSNPAGGVSGLLRLGGYSSVTHSRIMGHLNKLILDNVKIRLEVSVREISALPAMLRSGKIDYMVLDHAYEDSAAIETLQIGFEENVLIESASINSSRRKFYLDHDPEDKVTFRYFQKFDQTKLNGMQRLYVDDVYGIMEGVRLGWGRAVLPIHLIKDKKEFKVIQPSSVLKTPVILHFYRQAYTTQLHQAVVQAFNRKPN